MTQALARVRQRPRFPSLCASVLILLAAVAVLALTASNAEACPKGSKFFLWGGGGGCVANGKSVAKCWNMTNCHYRATDDMFVAGRPWCCPAPAGSTCVWRGTAPLCAGECEI